MLVIILITQQEHKKKDLLSDFCLISDLLCCLIRLKRLSRSKIRNRLIFVLASRQRRDSRTVYVESALQHPADEMLAYAIASGMLGFACECA